MERLGGFLKKLAGWRELLRTRPLHEGLARIYSDARIMPFLAGLEAGEQRVANLGALHQRALKFAGFSKQGLHRFLRFIEKLREQEADFGEAPVLSEASDVVRIMSVHKSKGLEFPVVIAAGLGGLLNLRSSGPVFVHRRLGIGMHVADVERNVFYPSAGSACILNENERSMRAEELRLLYVALTRARDHLILTGHVSGAKWVEGSGRSGAGARAGRCRWFCWCGVGRFWSGWCRRWRVRGCGCGGRGRGRWRMCRWRWRCRRGWVQWKAWGGRGRRGMREFVRRIVAGRRWGMAG